ncbi:MAG: hypothetical protein AB8B66_05620, partial [Rickettsiaceae bacterium]
GHRQIENKAGQDSTAFFNEHSGKVTNQGQIDLQKQAASEGLDANIMKFKITGTGNKLAQKQKDMTENANTQISSTENSNKATRRDMNERINEYEKDRIGQGNIVGKNLGIGGPSALEKINLSSVKNQLPGGGPQIPNIKPLKSGSKK